MSRSRRYSILLALAALLSLAAVAGGCDSEPDLEDLVEGETFEMGELRYNVLFTRTLNPNQVEDEDYLTGQKPAPPGQEYLGVFLLIDNRGDEDLTLPSEDDFEISESSPDETVYHPIPAPSRFAFPYGGTVAGDNQIPDSDSVAAAGPTQGSLLLFLVNEAVTENRPLKLHIESQGESAIVELDI